MERGGVGYEPAPIGVGLFGDDLALFDEPFQHAHDVEAIAATLETQGEVLEIDKDGQRAFTVVHGKSSKKRSMTIQCS